MIMNTNIRQNKYAPVTLAAASLGVSRYCKQDASSLNPQKG